MTTINAGPAGGWLRQLTAPWYEGANVSTYRGSGASITAGVLTVTGSGFGTKTVAAPLIFNDFESYADGIVYTSAGIEDLGTDSRAVLAVRTDQAFSGTKSLRIDWPDAYASCFPKAGFNLAGETEIYASFRHRYSIVTGTGVGDAGFGNVYKTCRAGSSTPYSGNPKFTNTDRPLFTVDPNNVNGETVGNLDDGTTPLAPGSLSVALWDTWARNEYRYKLSTPGVADGILQSWVESVVKTNYTANETRQTGSTALIDWFMLTNFDGYTGDWATWLDDIYIDNTPMRIEIGDNATYTSCTASTRMIQPPTAWADTSLTATLNQGGLTGTGYVFVFGADNLPINPTSGYAVSLP